MGDSSTVTREFLVAAVEAARDVFDEAMAAYLAWGRLPDGERTEERLRELDVARREADGKLGEAMGALNGFDGPPVRRIAELVREAGGTVLASRRAQ